MTACKSNDFYFWNFPIGIENGQTVRMAVGSREILITFRVSLFVLNAALLIKLCCCCIVIFPAWLHLNCSGSGKPSFPAGWNQHSLGCVHLNRSSRPGGLSHRTGALWDAHFYSQYQVVQQMSAPSLTSFPIHAKYWSLLTHGTFHWTLNFHLLS